MKVIVVGCGRLGSDLAYRLFRRGHEVSVIDPLASAFNNLPGDFEGRLNEGDVLNQDVLHRAGIETADALAAVTNSDSTNIVVGHLARTIYGVPNVVVRNYDPNVREVIEAFDLQLISSIAWGSQRLEELIVHNTARTVFSAGNGEIEIYEYTITAEWDGRKLNELLNPAEVRAVSLARAGKAFLPAENEVIKRGDVLLISATFDGAENVCKQLGLLKQEG